MISISSARARALWIHAQKLDQAEPFGAGAAATRTAVEHLGYVQIDTINVIERCHHHILFNRIPQYARDDLRTAQAEEKSVFEYWTHALSYVPVKDYRYYMNDMRRRRLEPAEWYASVRKPELQKVLRLIKESGAISIRDIEDDVLEEKDHPWASRKPSKRALQRAFYSGQLVISERVGMLKKYELANRHFAWDEKPRAARESEILEYMLERALRTQALVNVNSICHLDNKRKKSMAALLAKNVKRGDLLEVKVEGVEKGSFWVRPETLDLKLDPSPLTHILSPFDPLIIQRKRLHALFNYEHRFEAYVPKEKRVFGYFALPVLQDNQIVALLDLKTDRQQKKLLVQKWSWLPKTKSSERKLRVEEALERFEKFQLA